MGWNYFPAGGRKRDLEAVKHLHPGWRDWSEARAAAVGPGAVSGGSGEVEVAAVRHRSPGLDPALEASRFRLQGTVAPYTGTDRGAFSLWGILKVLIEAKSQGLVERIANHVDLLESTGMWMSDDIRRREFAS